LWYAFFIHPYVCPLWWRKGWVLPKLAKCWPCLDLSMVRFLNLYNTILHHLVLYKNISFIFSFYFLSLNLAKSFSMHSIIWKRILSWCAWVLEIVKVKNAIPFSKTMCHFPRSPNGKQINLSLRSVWLPFDFTQMSFLISYLLLKF